MRCASTRRACKTCLMRSALTGFITQRMFCGARLLHGAPVVCISDIYISQDMFALATPVRVELYNDLEINTVNQLHYRQPTHSAWH